MRRGGGKGGRAATDYGALRDEMVDRHIEARGISSRPVLDAMRKEGE